jgi:bacterioferritin-associated ferredoxin
MIICLCKNVSDRQIKELTTQGLKLCEVVKSSEAGTCCGACTEEVRKIVSEGKPPFIQKSSKNA